MSLRDCQIVDSFVESPSNVVNLVFEQKPFPSNRKIIAVGFDTRISVHYKNFFESKKILKLKFLTLLTLSRPRGSLLTSKIVWR